MINYIHYFNTIFILILLLFTFQVVAEENKPVNDGLITAKIRAQIALEPGLHNPKIKIRTHNGIVYLQGTLETDNEANALIEIGESVNGVKDVNITKLHVKDSKQPLTDTAITAKVKGLFIREQLFGDQDVPVMTINVKTNNGIVSLSGAADSEEQANNAVALAQSVNDVKRVDSRIEVKRSN